MGLEPVHILMGVRDGEAHLPDQLASIARQRGVAWHLTCSDDGSRDASRQIVEKFALDWPGRVSLAHGPRAGFAAHYMQLLARLPAGTGSVALSDQDDIWMPDKLRRALDRLHTVPDGTPALYAARRWVWDGANRTRRGPDRHVRNPGFRNALIENVAPGNTIVLNPAAAELARRMARLAGPVYAHDWWLYLLVTGAGGTILADPARVLLYRQHAGNAIGSGLGWTARITRKAEVLRGAFRHRVDRNIAALQRCEAALLPENRRILAQFAAARERRLAARLLGLGHVAPYRQTRAASAAFWGAAALGRV